LGERGTPRLTATEVITILRRHGFVRSGVSESHQKWRNAENRKQVIVPYHRGRILPPGTMKAIIAGSGIELSDWLK